MSVSFIFCLPFLRGNGVDVQVYYKVSAARCRLFVAYFYSEFKQLFKVYHTLREKSLPLYRTRRRSQVTGNHKIMGIGLQLYPDLPKTPACMPPWKN